MHELGVTQSILDTVLQQAKEYNVKRISAINLKVGVWTSIVPDCVQFYFEMLSEDTIAEGAELKVEEIPLTGRCEDCGEIFEIEEFLFVCPHCSGKKVNIEAGRELFIDSIEVE